MTTIRHLSRHCLTVSAVLLFTALWQPRAILAADPICTNLGPDRSFSTNNAWSIGYPFGPNQVGQAIAVSCSPQRDATLVSVDLAVSRPFASGRSEFVVAIYDDLNIKPNNVLAFAMGVAPDSLAMTTVNFGAPLQLRAGMRYWIGLHPAASQPTDLGWWWNLAEGQLQSQVWQSNTPTKVLMGQGWERSHLLIEPAYQLNALADSDGDGVPDSRDACPDRFGEPENNGCPTPITDRDGDEIPDNLDACPDEHGRAAHNGCPPPRPPRPPTTDLVTLRATFNGIPWPDISGLVSFWRVGASALITNLGPATARNFSVEFEFRPVAGGSGGRHQQSVSVSELRPGESMWVNTPQDPLNRGTMFIWPGAYTLTAFVDPSLRIAETDESNNVYVTPAFLPK